MVCKFFLPDLIWGIVIIFNERGRSCERCALANLAVFHWIGLEVTRLNDDSTILVPEVLGNVNLLYHVLI